MKITIQSSMPVIEFLKSQNNIKWLDITNPSKEELITISKDFSLHYYTLQDCLQPDHLPKHEELENAHFIITRIYTPDHLDDSKTIQEVSSKVAVFYNDEFIITIHRLEQPFLLDIKTKYLDKGRIKTTSEIVTKILWYVLHSYDLPAIQLSGKVDDYETRIFLKELSPDILEGLYYLKRKAGICNKLLLLTGEVINSIRTTSIDNPALQDAKDLHVKLNTIYDQTQEDVHNLLNIYISLSAQKTSDVMKVLTIFSVFFMPLTFIVGIYGMNFEFMPELRNKWGYPAVIIVMIIVTLAIYQWFKKKKWL
ncbi:MAG: CorA family divalent cation transporter [Chitinophagaceae bacterium]